MERRSSTMGERRSSTMGGPERRRSSIFLSSRQKRRQRLYSRRARLLSHEAPRPRPLTPALPSPAGSVYVTGEEIVIGGSMRNDEDNDREFFRRIWRRQRLLPPLGSPYAPRRQRWSMLLLVLVLIEAIYMPYCLCFQQPRVGGVLQLPPWVVGMQILFDACFW